MSGSLGLGERTFSSGPTLAFRASVTQFYPTGARVARVTFEFFEPAPTSGYCVMLEGLVCASDRGRGSAAAHPVGGAGADPGGNPDPQGERGGQ